MTKDRAGFNRRRLLQSSALGAVAAAAGILAAPSVLRAQAAGVKLGVLHPVSGALSYSGQQGRLGATIAVEEINAAGGIKALRGARIDAVLGDAQSDDPFCRDICRRAGMIIVSVDYRHAPEHPFPAAAEDAFAATHWIAEHAQELGGRPGPVLVAGWSAGGNLAAATCQMARDRGGPQIAGQLLICPVTDCSLERPSYSDNATGYFLTTALMAWFWDLYCPPEDRSDPRASPLRGELAGLPPAFVVTCEFDPLRDEGRAYAQALAAAGVPVEQLQAQGHFHSSFVMVDVMITGVGGRVQMAEALRRFAGLSPQAERGEASAQPMAAAAAE